MWWLPSSSYAIVIIIIIWLSVFDRRRRRRRRSKKNCIPTRPFYFFIFLRIGLQWGIHLSGSHRTGSKNRVKEMHIAPPLGLPSIASISFSYTPPPPPSSPCCCSCASGQTQDELTARAIWGCSLPGTYTNDYYFKLLLLFSHALPSSFLPITFCCCCCCCSAATTTTVTTATITIHTVVHVICI